MSTKFVTDREIAFINAINKELIQDVIGQEVYYYAILKNKSKEHRLYNEAIKKTWSQPIKINARVLWNEEPPETTGHYIDSKYRLEVYFHELELKDRNVEPKEGDFIEYGEIYFEIGSVTRPDIVFGQINNKVLVKCVCVPSREGQFQAGSESGKYDDRSNPVQQKVHVES